MRVEYFSADWCGPCKNQKQILDDAGIEYNEHDIDTDHGRELANQYGVRSLPTLVVLNGDGNPKRIHTGLTHAEDL